MSTFESINTLLAEYKAAKDAFRAKASEAYKRTLKQFFEENPEIKGITWTQFTPYWNDGDTCEFRVNEASFVDSDDLDVLADCTYGEYEGDGEEPKILQSWSYGQEEEFNSRLHAAILAFEEMHDSSEMEEIYLTMFGDHVRVMATAEGIRIEEYEHD